MIIDIHACISLNGCIADSTGSEDVFDDSNWFSMIELSKSYDAILYGRKTFEAVLSWGEEYINSFKHLKIYVLSNQHQKSTDNVIFVKNFNEIKVNKLLIEGGKSIYDFALDNLNINKIFFNVCPVIIENGLPFSNSKKIKDFNKIEITEKSQHFTQICLSK